MHLMLYSRRGLARKFWPRVSKLALFAAAPQRAMGSKLIACVPSWQEHLSALEPPSLCRKSMLNSSLLARREIRTLVSVEHRLHLTAGSGDRDLFDLGPIQLSWCFMLT
jgi:hypothetical protein